MWKTKSLRLEQGSHSTGKTGKMVKSNSRQGKHREFTNFGKKHRENTNFKIEGINIESISGQKLLRDIDGFIFDV